MTPQALNFRYWFTTVHIHKGHIHKGKRGIHMAVRKRVGAVMALVTAICTFATAPAHADPVAMAPQTYTKVTRDGWTLVIRIDHETINSVPNLAEASNSREAFVTFDATAVATGGSAPITDSLFHRRVSTGLPDRRFQRSADWWHGWSRGVRWL